MGCFLFFTLLGSEISESLSGKAVFYLDKFFAHSAVSTEMTSRVFGFSNLVMVATKERA